LTFWGSRQSWIILDFVWGHGEAFWDSMYPRYLQEVAWNSHLSAWATSQLVPESAEYFPNVGFVLRNVVGVDEDAIQKKYMMNMTSIMSAKTSFINL